MMIEWIPDGLSPLVAVALLLVSLLTSMVTASMGAGGGVILLMVLSLCMPPLAVIPVHGMVQMGSNAGRSLMTWRHIRWPVLAWFAPGMVVGTIAGGLLLVRLPQAVWQVLIALFVLYLCWGPPLPRRAVGRAGILVVAAVTSFLSLFVGASGPLVAAYIKQMLGDRFATVSTFSATMLLQHGPKVLVFTLAGFDFLAWLPLIVAMITTGAVGTWLGLKVLGKLSDSGFRRFFNLFLTLMALRLLWLSASDVGLL